MEVLALDDPEVAAWAEEERPLLHLLMGDSVARDSGLRTRNDRDRVFCSARGGATGAPADPKGQGQALLHRGMPPLVRAGPHPLDCRGVPEARRCRAVPRLADAGRRWSRVRGDPMYSCSLTEVNQS